ncbi:MAG: hypothetical protein RM368_36575 [Nostoc sp. DedSLP03]|uniref:hypothetical protein n=1 Tax=Nostoc sp. DedSLP03 TaxID=3075400 RepID=UPI002AD5971C|nr:hypothetical protein [Nostoc sp. DedSLP03]MDZ7970386.1 hypothetical protein [Nostoc sp. DedSLP03]
MPRRHVYPCLLERMIDKLSAEARQAWTDFATSAKTLLELQAWWNQRGFHPSLDSLSLWRKKNVRAGETAAVVLEVVSKSKGIDAKSCLEYCATTSIVLANKLQEKLEEEWTRNEAQTLLNCLKECRSSAIALAEMQAKSDKIEFVLGGAYELSTRAKRLSEGQPQSEWLEATLQAALSDIEDELKSQYLAAKS